MIYILRVWWYLILLLVFDYDENMFKNLECVE